MDHRQIVGVGTLNKSISLIHFYKKILYRERKKEEEDELDVAFCSKRLETAAPTAS